MNFDEAFARFDYYIGVGIYILLSGMLMFIPLAISWTMNNIIIWTLAYIYSICMYHLMKWLFKYFKIFSIWKAKKLYHTDLMIYFNGNVKHED